MILDKGFAWNGQTYGSLSQVAKAMTGTSWNGHRFFGLRTARSDRSGMVTRRSAGMTLGIKGGSGANGRIWPAMMSAELSEGWA